MNAALGQINERSAASFAHRREILQPFGGLDRVISWCRSEMQSEWRWQVLEPSSDHRPGRYCFYFDSERDCVAFVLHWT